MNRQILVQFVGSHDLIQYTAAIWGLLVTDPATETILDAETGEVLWAK